MQRPGAPLQKEPPLPHFEVPDILSNATVAVLAITRDDGAHLPRALRMLRACMNHFKDYDMIILENDSSDGSQDLLRKWAKADSRIMVESRNMSTASAPPPRKAANLPPGGFVGKKSN